MPNDNDSVFEISVPVTFTGTVKVRVPSKRISLERAKILAKKKALAHVLATVENPDAPDGDAYDDYLAETNDSVAEVNWDTSKATEVSGVWQ